MTRQEASVLFLTGFLALAIASCTKSGVQAGRENTPTGREILSLDDKTFLLQAQRAEIRQQTLAEGGLQKTKNVKVREFAQRIVSERYTDLPSLLSLMKAKGMDESPVITEELQIEAENRLSQVTGASFDHEFVSLLAAEQEETVRRFDLASFTATDPDIRAYATVVLPSLRKDRDDAMALEQSLR